MKSKLTKLLVLLSFANFFYKPVCAQSFSFSCTKDTLIPRCTVANCFTITATIPDIHIQSGAYTVNPIGETPSGCFPVYVQPNDPGGTIINLIDDEYSGILNIGFPFPFYGTVYNNLLVSPNGVTSFDVARASQGTHWGILRGSLGNLVTSGGVPENLPSALYDAALIMAPYHEYNTR
jgi:hypothetical protein